MDAPVADPVTPSDVPAHEGGGSRAVAVPPPAPDDTAVDRVSETIRDVLAGRRTLLMRPERYAVPVCMGCVAYVFVLEFLPAHRLTGATVCILARFAMRAAAIRWNAQMPGFASLQSGGESK